MFVSPVLMYPLRIHLFQSASYKVVHQRCLRWHLISVSAFLQDTAVSQEPQALRKNKMIPDYASYRAQSLFLALGALVRPGVIF